MTTKQLKQAQELLDRIEFNKGKLLNYELALNELNYEKLNDIFYLDIGKESIEVTFGRLSVFITQLVIECKEEINKLNDKFSKI